jgi:cytochrome c biogenesis protein ResB
MKNFFLSLKTSVWTLFFLVCLFFIGSYMMPMHPEVFGTMNADTLLRWVEHTAMRSPAYAWWFFAAVAGLVLLTVNTIICSLQAIRGKWARADVLLWISPQVIHIGFLFILLAHLLGAGWGYKLSGMMPQGAVARLPEDRALLLRGVRVQTDEHGYPTDWSADVSLYEHNQLVKSGTLGPNAPLFYGGAGIYLKDLNFDRGQAAILLIAKDPGAVWALGGGFLFMLGSVALLVLKWKKT